MCIDKELDTVKKTSEVVAELMKTAGNTPEVKEAAKNMGNAALTISKTINNALLPLAAINYSFDKAKKYFSETFEKDMEEKASKIPPEDIIEPKASIAGPTLQGLAFSHEESNLKEMYLSLLSTSMNRKESQNAHPAFVEVIKQLTSEEANLLNSLFHIKREQGISEIRQENKKSHEYWVRVKHLININNLEHEFIERDIPSAIDNFIRLGLYTVDYTQTLKSKDYYSWIEDSKTVKSLKKLYEDKNNKIIFIKGIISLTDFGLKFKHAIKDNN